MSKRISKMRWRASDEELIEKTINNFNAKIYRLRRKAKHETPMIDGKPISYEAYVSDYLPQPITAKERKAIIGNIYSRNEFNKIVNRYKRFSRKGAEDPVKTTRSGKGTKWKIDEINIGNRTRNQIRKAKREEFGEKELTSFGVPVGSKRKEQGEAWEEYLKPVEFDVMNKSNVELDRTLQAIDAEIMDSNRIKGMQSYKDNYISALEDWGYHESIIRMVERIPIDLFYETTILDTDATIEFLYYSSYQEFLDKSNALTQLWSAVEAKAEKAGLIKTEEYE